MTIPARNLMGDSCITVKCAAPRILLLSTSSFSAQLFRDTVAVASGNCAFLKCDLPRIIMACFSSSINLLETATFACCTCLPPRTLHPSSDWFFSKPIGAWKKQQFIIKCRDSFRAIVNNCRKVILPEENADETFAFSSTVVWPLLLTNDWSGQAAAKAYWPGLQDQLFAGLWRHDQLGKLQQACCSIPAMGLDQVQCSVVVHISIRPLQIPCSWDEWHYPACHLSGLWPPPRPVFQTLPAVLVSGRKRLAGLRQDCMVSPLLLT